MLSLEFGGKDIVSFPFREQERKIVGNHPIVEVYLTDSEEKLFKAPASEFAVSLKENEIIIEFNGKRTGLIKVS